MIEKVKEIYESLPTNKWGHVKRVLAFATKISKELNLNNQEKKIIQLSVLLHDVGYKLEIKEGKKKHQEYSVDMVDELTKELNLTEQEISTIKETISTHSDFDRCKTLFQKVLFDADKLEKTILGEVIRKSIILNKKYDLNDEEIFEQFEEKFKKTKFHLDISKKIAENNLKSLSHAMKDHRSLVNISEEIISNIKF